MTGKSNITRPKALADVVRDADSLHAFGMNLRDWQHEMQRGGVHSRSELQRRLADAPGLCRGRFVGGDIADAYLAAYAEWMADRAGVGRPAWSAESDRVADAPWFSTPLRARLLATAPASFRQRNIFTIPEAVFQPAAGRPRGPAAEKRKKAIQRQKTYRDRIRLLVARARALEIS